MPPRAPRILPLALLVVAGAFLYALWFHDKGLAATEEGLILAEAEAVLAGKVPYRDIDCFVTPGAWYVAALVLELGGHTLNAARITAALLFAATVGILWAITAMVASRAAGAAVCVCMLVLKVIAFPLGNFIWYTEFSVFFALVALGSLLAFEKRGGAAWLVAAGASVALSVLFKQNLGGVLLLASTLFVLVFHRGRRELAAFLIPVFALGGATLAYFGLMGALPQLISGLVSVPLTRYGGMDVSYLSIFSPRALTSMESYVYWPTLFWEERFLEPGWGAGWMPVARAIGLLVYATPIALVTAVGLRALRERRIGRIPLLLLGTALTIFQSSFPRSDFAHVAQTLPGFLPLGAFVLQRAHPRRALIALAPVGVAAVVFSFALVLHMPYKHLLEHPRARVYLSEPAGRGLAETLDWIETEIPRDEPVAFVPSGPIYYFLADRPVPYRYTVMLPPNVAFDGGADAVRLLKELDIRYVILGSGELPGMPPLEGYAPELDRYLRAHYEPVVSRRFRQIPTVQFLVRHAEP